MATIYDVAKRAGVSHTAVSAVLNGKTDQVGAETRQRILDAIQALEYRPSRVARQLATGRSNTVALCFERPFRHLFLNPVNSSFIAGIGESVSESGYSLLIAPVTEDRPFEQTIRNLPSQGVEGAIIIGAILLKKTTLAAIDACEIPVVCIDSYPGFTRASTVDIDNAQGMARGVEHLIAQGHRRIVFVGPTPIHQCLIDRTRAFCEALQEAGIAGDEDSVRIVQERRAERFLREMLQADDRPTALVCGQGAHGEAACAAARSLGLRIPEDLALLVFDAIPPENPCADRVSTIQPTPFEMGTAAADALKRILSGDAVPPVTIRLPAKLILRLCPAPRA